MEGSYDIFTTSESWLDTCASDAGIVVHSISTGVWIKPATALLFTSEIYTQSLPLTTRNPSFVVLVLWAQSENETWRAKKKNVLVGTEKW